ncbi:MAG: NADH-quinone oxidoreductase subunit A, partial [Flavobacteriales bacterium]
SDGCSSPFWCSSLSGPAFEQALLALSPFLGEPSITIPLTSPPHSRSTPPVEHAPSPADYLPILLQTLIAMGFVGFVLALAAWVGPKVRGTRKDDSFECGIDQQGNARMPFSVKYLLIAILFVLFDVEIIFLYPWAVNFKALGVLGFVEMLVFVTFVLAGLYYVLRKGVMKFE